MKPWLALSCLALTTAIFVPAVAEAAPSFDCRKAKSVVEKTICADREFAAQDSEIAVLFARAVSTLTASAPAEVAKLRADQRAWLQTRDDCGDLIHGVAPVVMAEVMTCLREQLSSRIVTLKRVIETKTLGD